MRYTPKHASASNSTAGRKVAGIALAGAATVGAGVTQASGASADTSVWDRVANCESTNNWSINSGNGFFGGLQFTEQTWLGYGGGAYASSAQYASRAQQIAVAQKVLAGQGPGAWPVCSIKAGLTRSNGGSSSAAAITTTAATTTVSRSAARSAITSTPAASTSTSNGKLVVDGIIGPRTTRALQAQVGAAQTGVLDRATKIRLQAWVGTYQDGIVGPKTVAALQSKLGIPHDGAWYFNGRTVRALQTYLNNH